MQKYVFMLAISIATLVSAQEPLTFQGTQGPGAKKHIVFVAGDHEYRSEESLPALARLLAKHHGFKCTALFNIDPGSGEIAAGIPSNIPYMDALDTADLAVVFLRFQNLPDEQMKHCDAYLNRGGPVVGMRTATHAFQIPDNDLTNDGYRRMICNGIFWTLGLEDNITPDMNVAVVGPFKPNTFGNQTHARGIKPEMYAGFESPIPATNNTNQSAVQDAEKKDKPKAERSKKKSNRKVGVTVSVEPPAGVLVTGKPARFVRIELPGDKRILTLAEVEVFSDSRNIATGRKATQSSTNGDGKAARALDGNKDSDWNKGGQTHTTNDGSANPWWEVDLGTSASIEKVGIWNRSGFENRLDGFTITLLDSDRKEVFRAANIAAPEVMEIDVKQGGKLTYLAFDGKPGAPVKNDGKKQESQPSNEPVLVDVPSDYRDQLPFAFHTGDVVAILGNGLPDRMQHDGWKETLLQSELQGKQIRFRNMSASGDRPDSFPRSQGATSMTEYLQHVKADVVFAFFGYNESFEGVEKAGEHQQKLVEFVRKTRGSQANGKTFPRIVLFSPIAHENTHSANVPDGEAHNIQLEAYTRATAAAAEEAGVAFVDLFHPSLELFNAASTPLTINGVHLTSEGNRRLAEVIATALFRKRVGTSGTMEPLRSTVLDKDSHWNNRYRARDGNDVWGGRSTLTFTNDQSNAVVLQQELSMLDVMTMNRDARVWSVAQGKELPVDDSNVPMPVAVISNVGGGSKSSSAEKEGKLDYVSGEEGIRHMAVAEGFQVGLFADEAQFPQLANPVQIQFDTKGRLWAAVWPTYPKWEPLKEMNDALIIVHDENSDGKADRVTEFARVQNPLGFEFWNGGVIVTCAPEILFLKDTDGDDVADVRIIMLQGVDSSDTHHGANNLIYGPDGAIYWQSGVFMQHNHEHPWGPSLQAAASAMYRFDPRRFTISLHANNSPNPHGIAFDRWGYHYATDGTGGRAYQVRPEGKGFEMHELLKKEVRPVTACEVVSSTHFPESMEGDFLICNVIGFLGIKHYHLDRNAETGTVWGEPVGADLTVTTINADGSTTLDKSRGLLMSGDKNFRPSDAIFAPDGSLYFSDWHNAIIGHMQHNVRDPNRDHVHGRIYRLTAVGRPLQQPVAIDGQPIAALLENLKSPVDSIRHRTRVELSERNSAEVIAATKQWVKTLDPDSPADAHHLLEALWLHQQHNVRDSELMGELLKSPDPHARIAANTVKHLWFNVENSMHGGVIAAETMAAAEKSGILSDTPELTTIRIGTIPERMRYDVTELTVKPGKKVKLTFANADFMPHNILLVKPGSDNDIGLKAMALGAGGFAVSYVPESSDILWSSKLVDHGQEQVIEFSAPAEEGAYPYICSFPGHHLLMRGTMYVTNDLKEFLVKNPRPVLKTTEWKLGDLQEDVTRVGQHRNFFRGQQLFTTLACAQCHKMTGADPVPAALHNHDHAAGHSHGPSLTVGPDLTDVVKKHKGDAKLVLQEIVEPSRNIEEKYRKFMFEMDSGKYVIGNIVTEDKETVIVQTGPTADTQQTVAKNEIESRRPSPISIMPAGILNTLDKEQILDLLAYVLATGKADHPAFLP